MKTTLYFNWFRDVFVRNIGEKRSVLLIYDGHTTHISTKLIRLAVENQLTIMKLPPHTTYVLQPLDVAVFKGLKTNWNKELCKWQRANPRKKIPKPEFVSLITNLTKAVPATHIINGFKTTSIYDAEMNGVNKDIIPETICKKADLERYKNHLPNPNEAPPEVPTTVAVLPNEAVTTAETILSEVRAALTPPSAQEVSTTSIVVVLPEIAQVSAAEQPAVATTSMDESRKSFEELLLNLLKKAIC